MIRLILTVMTFANIFPVMAEGEFYTLQIPVPTPKQEEFIVHKDLAYLDDGDQRTRADIYLPVEENKDNPAVIFVHGGPIPEDFPMARDWKMFQSYGSLVTGAGLAGVVFNHRFNHLNDLEKATKDISATINFVRKNADKYTIDKNNICLWFFSGGGSFVPHFISEKPKWLKCMVMYYQTIGADVWVSWDEKVSDSQRTSLDPIPLLEVKSDWSPAFFIAEAGLDNAELNAGIRKFALSAIENGWKVEYLNHPTGPHGFDIHSNDKRAREIIFRTISFLNEQLDSEQPKNLKQ